MCLAGLADVRPEPNQQSIHEWARKEYLGWWVFVALCGFISDLLFALVVCSTAAAAAQQRQVIDL